MMSTRLDRSVSVNLFHPLSRLANGRSAARVPILMYHGVREGTPARHPYYEINTSPLVFAQHMKFLSENGYTTLRLDKLVAHLAGGQEGCSAKRHVVITFDDGYRDFHTHAYPVLARYGFTATVFLVTAATGNSRSKFNGADCLTWDEVRQLHTHGVGFGSHTVSHPELRFLSESGLDYQITSSRQAIEDAIGHAVRSFAYPYAFPEADRGFVLRLAELLEKRGYETGVSTILGTARPGVKRFSLPRLPINSWDDPKLFQAKLEGGYDWLHRAQYLVKAFKSLNPLPARRRPAQLKERLLR